MTQQTLLDTEATTAVSQLPRNQSSEHPEKDAPGYITAIVVDAAVQVGALIDAVCCRSGDWIDWQHYRPHPRMSIGNHGVQDAVVRLMLTADERGLRDGGYIEVRVMPEEMVIEADGGYYDAYHQPEMVIDGSLRWHELNPQRLAQVLMLMHNRIMREYVAGARSEESLQVPSAGVD